MCEGSIDVCHPVDSSQTSFFHDPTAQSVRIDRMFYSDPVGNVATHHERVSLVQESGLHAQKKLHKT